MIYHYEFALSSFVVLILLCILSLRREYLPIRRNRFFRMLLGMEGLTLVFDILSSEMDAHYPQFSSGALYLANMVFFLGFIWRAYFDFSYIESLMRERGAIALFPRWLVDLPSILSTLVLLSAPLTGLIFSIDAQGYHSGPLYRIIYANAYFYLLIMITLSIIGLRRFSWTRIEQFSLVGAWLVLCVGYVVRMYASPYLVMDSFYMLGILIQYFAFQNPGIFLDRRTGALNHATAVPYLQELNDRGPFFAFAIGINDYMESCSLYGERQMTKGLRAITRYLWNTFPDCQVIYATVGRFILLSTKEHSFSDVRAQISARMQAPWVDTHAHLYLTVSYAMFYGQLQRYEDVEHFFDYTAMALHRAETQHDVIVMEQSLFDQARLNAKVWRAIDRAIETNAVEIYFQPLYGTQQRRIIGAEVLARIHDKELGFIRPDIFITVAERSGSITQLGEQVFEKACLFLAAHPLRTLGLERLNLNLSPIQCRDSHMAEHLCCIAQRHKVPIHSFRFEITESALSYEQRLRQNMDMLIAQGAVLSLDDFGTGYSNLMRVLKFPFEDVKFDMSFVRAYFDQTNKLLPAIIEGFQSFGVQITAEGIENKQMADTLTTFGCRILQGFYFAKPLPMDEFLHYLKTTAPTVRDRAD